MDTLKAALFLAVLATPVWVMIYITLDKYVKKTNRAERSRQNAEHVRANYLKKQKELEERLSVIKSIETDAKTIKNNANRILEENKQEANNIILIAQEKSSSLKYRAEKLENDAKLKLEASTRKAEVIILNAQDEAEKILESSQEKVAQAIEEAKQKALQDNQKIIQETKDMQNALKAFSNRVHGYVDDCAIAATNYIDDIAEQYTGLRAAQEYKEARAKTRELVKLQKAVYCHRAEPEHQDKITRLMLLAFDGEADAIISNIKTQNHGKLYKKLEDTATIINAIGKELFGSGIYKPYLQSRLNELSAAHKIRIFQQLERDEQRAAKEQMREERRAQAELEAAEKKAKKEQEIAQKAYEQALTDFESANEQEKDILLAKLSATEEELQAALEKQQRALSMAQQTKAGHCYIISNIGSFGKNMCKIGMTRRLEPMDRVKELGDASVPFPFDVHAMIYSEDCPSLENTLHKKFETSRVNLINNRKEFFYANVTDIKKAVEELGIDARWTLTAMAEQWRESEAMRQSQKRPSDLDVVI